MRKKHPSTIRTDRAPVLDGFVHRNTASTGEMNFLRLKIDIFEELMAANINYFKNNPEVLANLFYGHLLMIYQL